MIDSNVYLSRWPFRRLPLDDTSALVEKFDGQGVEQAWVGSFDALLHRDLGDVNQRLAAECEAATGDCKLLAFGAVNLTLPDWQEDLRRCVEEYGMRGVRLHPNYQGYSLDDNRFVSLVDLANEAGLIVQIAVRMEDDRTQHPLLRVPDVDISPLVGFLEKHPELRIVLLNSQRTVRGPLLEELSRQPNVFFEIAMLEGIGGVGKFIRQVPHERLLYGSYAPFFYPESAQLKLVESELGQTIRSAVTTGNARRLLPVSSGC